MYDVENVPLVWRMQLALRGRLTRSCNIMAALGYVYTLEKQILRSPKGSTSWNATSTEFLEFKIFPCIPCMTGICRCVV